METTDLNTWEDFLSAIAEIRNPSPSKVPLSELIGQSNVLFRGQGDADWKLQTTLERAPQNFADCEWSLSSYYHVMLRVHPAIVAHTGRNWTLAGSGEYDLWASHHESVATHLPWRGYEFMAYLRHHGFPSPLLDWSRSPYIAAFFAFQPTPGASDRVAVFAYREDSGRGKVISSDGPRIVQLSEYTPTHARHFLQQCQYTVCVKYDARCSDYTAAQQQTGGFVYANHGDVFDKAYAGQDQLWRLTLPRALRSEVLAELNDFNLNSYSLFASEDSLVQTLAAREFR